MKNIFTLLILVITMNGIAQVNGELVIFSNLGERFFVMVNGERQNFDAGGNVKVEGLLPGYYSCKVISENNLYVLDKNFEVKPGMCLTLRIVEAKKSTYKLRYFSETPTSEAQQLTSNQSVVVYHPAVTVPPVVTTPSTVTQTQTTHTSTPTTMTNGATTGSENVNINMNMSETGFSTGISTTGLEEENYSQTMTISTTTTTTEKLQEENFENHHSATNTVGRPTQNTFSANCMVDHPGMVKVIEVVKNESFSESKMGVAKQFTKNRCLTVSQIKEITQLFNFSEDKMEYLKFAHSYCLNTQDYYQLSEVFSFSDDKNKFNKFINGK